MTAIDTEIDNAIDFMDTTPGRGDIVHYGEHPWQWGVVVDLDPGMKREICVRRRNRIWVKRSAITQVIPARDWRCLRDDVRNGEPFVTVAERNTPTQKKERET